MWSNITWDNLCEVDRLWDVEFTGYVLYRLIVIECKCLICMVGVYGSGFHFVLACGIELKWAIKTPVDGYI